jgi:hypothetical protein
MHIGVCIPSVESLCQGECIEGPSAPISFLDCTLRVERIFLLCILSRTMHMEACTPSLSRRMHSWSTCTNQHPQSGVTGSYHISLCISPRTMCMGIYRPSVDSLHVCKPIAGETLPISPLNCELRGSTMYSYVAHLVRRVWGYAYLQYTTTVQRWSKYTNQSPQL